MPDETPDLMQALQDSIAKAKAASRMPDDHDRMAHMVGDARKRAMESSYAHTWVPDDDEGMWICSECDTYRGSAGSLKDCPALLDQDAETRSAL